MLAPIAILGGLLAGSSHIGLASTAVTGSLTDKPYTATTPDSGSDGNNWAIDLFTRSFQIFPKATDGTTKVVEHFNGGHFITLGDGATGSAASPEVATYPTHLLREGVSGSFFGTFTIVVNAGFTYHSGGGCGQVVSGATTDDGCTTAQWIALNFSGAVYGTDTTTTAYSLTYKAVGTGLLGSKWVDACVTVATSCATKTDSGDIYTS
ncbi:MAG TPA: hypothetical protein VIM76_01160 [Candidatus Dormibacteraeota bacterium]